MEKEEIKDLDKIEPINYSVVAKPHTPIYKMHRYFARRPYTVFRELIKHYSNPGSIILDPMCGGGVTIVEGLKLRRKVIGVDLNPMAIFITRCEVMDVDLNKLKRTFHEISEKVRDEINSFYLTICPKCKKETPADWFEWSTVVECTNCEKEVVFAETKKLGPGKYQCPHCKNPVKSLGSKRKPDKIVRIKLRCRCGFKSEKQPDEYDFEKYKWIEDNFDKIVKEKNLWYPKDKIEDLLKGWKPEKNRVIQRGIKYFYELFNKRELLIWSYVFAEFNKIKENNLKYLLNLLFSEGIRFSCKFCYRKKGQPVGWGAHGYWIPDTPVETNILNTLMNRFDALIEAKEESKNEIGLYWKEANRFNDLEKESTCFLLNQSATSLKNIPDSSIDVIITDPPYGSNVNYMHLCYFNLVWVKNILNLKENEIYSTKDEAIVNKHENKNIGDYRKKMYEIFKECYRVLKPNRWMVMTFHNREFKVWSALHLAAHDAGFIWSEKDGMIYQPPIELYTTTLHQRAAGSMLGDFILSYKKAEKPPEEKWIEDAEVGSKIRQIARETIEYHGGAKLSTIYMRLMPFLLNTGNLEKIQEKDLIPFLQKEFIQKGDKWYFKEHIDPKTNEVKVDLIEFAPVKSRLEFIIRRFLYKQGRATTDEILGVVYSNLINSNAAEYEEIMHVVNRICVPIPGERRQGGRRTWQLKELRDQELLFKEVEKRLISYTEESQHDILIEQLVKIGQTKGYDSHIGQTEQKKYKIFQDMSIPMGNNVQYGIPANAFNRIRDIDVLWLKGYSIVSAFEVEKSTTIDSAITRFRELFAATPTLDIPAYIVIPDSRENEAKKKIGSLANRREGLTERIKYILFSDLIDKTDVDLKYVAKKVE